MLFGIELAIVLFLFLAYNHVISELRTKSRLQKEIQLQVQFIETILDNSVDLILVFDTRMTLLAANRKAKEMTGISEMMIGKSFFDYFPNTKGTISHQSLEKAFEGEHAHIKKHTHLHLDRQFESFFVPLFKDGNIYAAIAIHHDITDLVKASEELESRNTELVASNQELERFAYIASHDLQEPLRKIRMFADMAPRYSCRRYCRI